MSTLKNILKNSTAVLLQKIVRLIEQLILVPFFISAWGAAYYGEWLTLTVLPGILALSDFGFGSAAANTFVLRYAGGDIQGAANILKSGFVVVSSIITIIMFISALIFPLLEYYDVFNHSIIPADDAFWAVYILIFAKLISFYTQLNEARFRAARVASKSINLISFFSLSNIIAGIIILEMDYGIIAYAFSQLLTSILFNLIYGWQSKSVLTFPSEYKAEVKKIDIKMISKKGIGYLLSPVWQSIYFQGTTLAVRLSLGPEAVALFNTTRTATRSVSQLINLIDAVIFPEMIYEIGSNELKKVQKIFRVSIIGSLIIALLGSVFLYVFGLWFYNLWTAGKLVISEGMWNIFVTGIVFNALWWVCGVVFRAFNQPMKFNLAGVICSCISVVSTYLFSKQFGLLGAATGYLVLDVLMSFYALPASSKLIKTSILSIASEGSKEIFVLSKQLLVKTKEFYSRS